MTSSVVTVSPDTPFKEVVERLVRADVSGLPVVDDDGALLGLVTEADLISKPAYRRGRHRALALLADVVAARDHHWATKAAGLVAADVMTHSVVVCTPDDPVPVAARRMLRHHVKRMPVVSGNALVGIISRHDVLKVLDRPDAEVAGDVRAALSNRATMPEDHHVTFSVADGVVTLAGDVRYAWDVEIVVSIVRDVPGVIDVVNLLHNREPNPHIPTDQWMFGAR